jgi:RNA polymerase sigma-70 factor (sigma-E family)
MTDRISHRLAVIYEQHAESLLRLAYALSDEPAEAEDLVQEAFVRLYATFRERGEPHSVYAYLRRTIVNLSLNRIRRARVRRARAEVIPDVRDPSGDIDSVIVFDQALAKLPARQRAALVLRFMEDLSEHQAADLLGSSPAAVKQLVARGLKAMRQEGEQLRG